MSKRRPRFTSEEAREAGRKGGAANAKNHNKEHFAALGRKGGKHKNHKKTHGMTLSKTYISWRSMKTRCLNKNQECYKHYGGRGITVCKRWMTFENFLADMGQAPPGLTLDRYPNNNGNYEPGNCRWATMSEQKNNTRRNRIIEFNGTRDTLCGWANKIGIRQRALNYRLKHWSHKDAFTREPKKYSRRVYAHESENCEPLENEETK